MGCFGMLYFVYLERLITMWSERGKGGTLFIWFDASVLHVGLSKKKVPTYIVKVCDWICLNVWWCLLRNKEPCSLPIVKCLPGLVPQILFMESRPISMLITIWWIPFSFSLPALTTLMASRLMFPLWPKIQANNLIVGTYVFANCEVTVTTWKNIL